ncbi:MAG: DNA-3-methyladenine glycosylase I, partial [Propionibacteriaceae bacterium]|nr:DNA-3-methyladenine glycosylase I [Propionibacteriaceae bacterium]
MTLDAMSSADVNPSAAPPPEGAAACPWPGSDPAYRAYHDQEWGRPVHDDQRLFEKLVLEGFQAGLSWLTILRKREAFREVFAGFDPRLVAEFGAEDVERLMGDERIVRNRRKIEAAIANAQSVLALAEEHGTFSAFVREFAPVQHTRPTTMDDVPAHTAESKELARALKRAGARFVGPTTIYAFMQAMGVVND